MKYPKRIQEIIDNQEESKKESQKLIRDLRKSYMETNKIFDEIIEQIRNFRT